MLPTLDRWIYRATASLVVLLMAAMIAVIGLQVFCRYVLNASLIWPEELARYAMVWVTCLASALAVRQAAHVGIDSVIRRLPDPARRAVVLGGQAEGGGGRDEERLGAVARARDTERGPGREPVRGLNDELGGALGLAVAYAVHRPVAEQVAALGQGEGRSVSPFLPIAYAVENLRYACERVGRLEAKRRLGRHDVLARHAHERRADLEGGGRRGGVHPEGGLLPGLGVAEGVEAPVAQGPAALGERDGAGVGRRRRAVERALYRRHAGRRRARVRRRERSQRPAGQERRAV
jgi:hypothetical protein